MVNTVEDFGAHISLLHIGWSSGTFLTSVVSDAAHQTFTSARRCGLLSCQSNVIVCELSLRPWACSEKQQLHLYTPLSSRVVLPLKDENCCRSLRSLSSQMKPDMLKDCTLDEGILSLRYLVMQVETAVRRDASAQIMPMLSGECSLQRVAHSSRERWTNDLSLLIPPLPAVWLWTEQCINSPLCLRAPGWLAVNRPRSARAEYLVATPTR